MKRIFLCLIFGIFSYLTYSQVPNLSSYKNKTPNISYQDSCEGKETIKIPKDSSVALMFFQDKSDTVVIYVNGKRKVEKYLMHDEKLVSTDYTGFLFTIDGHAKTSLQVIILYKECKCYLEFSLNKTYPLYGVYFLSEQDFDVSARRCPYIIK